MVGLVAASDGVPPTPEDPYDCAADPGTRCHDLPRSIAVIESTREMKGKVTRERRYYISSLAPDAERLAKAVRQHWGIENRVHWCFDVAVAYDQMRARTAHAAHNWPSSSAWRST